MIGVCCEESEKPTVREFFELFKTPWEFCVPARQYDVVVSTLSEMSQAGADLTIIFSSGQTELDARNGILVDVASSRHEVVADGIRLPIYGSLARLQGVGAPFIYDRAAGEVVGAAFTESATRTLRVGYDLFGEVAFLLTEGQPAENAFIPALELHIALLREWIVGSGIPLVEIPPVPWGHPFAVSLTHDVDFAGIRPHLLDHTMWGFVYRALAGSCLDLCRGAGSWDRLRMNWLAAFSLPLVYLKAVDDFWAHFDRYAELDGSACSTFFLIPYKRRVGDRVQSSHPARRATRYDIADVRPQVQALVQAGCEIGLHGIDAWHSVEQARQERRRIVEVASRSSGGVRIHWLWCDRNSPAVLEQAGFDYDATCGYNETIGYRAGTVQVFKPLGANRLLELPLHIQDTALFYPRRLGLTEAEAWELCDTPLTMAARFGGVLTVSWHDRSLVPERLWGSFYRRLLQALHDRGAWFATATRIVQWFRARRLVVFEECSFTSGALRLRLRNGGGDLDPCMTVRVYPPRQPAARRPSSEAGYLDFPYAGESSVELTLNQEGGQSAWRQYLS